MYRQIIQQVLEKKRCRPVASQEGFTALCPFHDDDHSSFAIRASDGVFICYAQQCGKTGNIRSFLRGAGGFASDRVESMVKDLPRTAPLTIKRLSPYGSRDPPQEFLPERQVAIYGSLCPKYMLDRGFEKRTLKHFEVGFDTDRQHVMIPVRSPEGKLMGFVRRATVWGEVPRYTIDVVSNRRGGVLFNLHRVLASATSEVVIVEGALDCMWLYQVGVLNVVALLGTTLSHAQERLLKRSFDTFTLMLDNDLPGRAATEKYVKRLSRHGTVSVAADLPTGKDAAESGPSEIAMALREKVYGPKWLVQQNPKLRIAH